MHTMLVEGCCTVHGHRAWPHYQVQSHWPRPAVEASSLDGQWVQEQQEQQGYRPWEHSWVVARWADWKQALGLPVVLETTA